MKLDSIMTVFVTVPDENVGKAIGRACVEHRLVACVNIIPKITSIYMWKEKIEENTEVLLLLKTSAEKLLELEKFIKTHHPYDTPEFVVLKAKHTEERYREWLLDTVQTTFRRETAEIDGAEPTEKTL